MVKVRTLLGQIQKESQEYNLLKSITKSEGNQTRYYCRIKKNSPLSNSNFYSLIKIHFFMRDFLYTQVSNFYTHLNITQIMLEQSRKTLCPVLGIVQKFSRNWTERERDKIRKMEPSLLFTYNL